MPLRRIVKVERLKDDGQTLSFFVRPGSRSKPWIWFKPEDMPSFEGEEAMVECERRAGRWVPVRVVPRD
jgi:hypothetical protein